MTPDQSYLKAILATVARQAFPPEALMRLVAPRSDSDRAVAAYNLCDGSRANSEIAKLSRVDNANLSRLIKRWVELGIMLRVEVDGQSRPVHVYPIPIGE